MACRKCGYNARPGIEIDEFYGCPRVNGILFPQPINYMPLPLAPPLKDGVAFQHQEELADFNKPRKKRRLMSSQVTHRKEFSLKLLRCEEDNDFILVMHEVATGISTFFILLPYEKSGKIKLEAKEIFIGHNMVSSSSPITEEIYPHMPNKCNLSMLERLDGLWTVEIRERAGNTKTEKFYYHEKVNKTFRSLNDVATFIIYRVIY